MTLQSLPLRILDFEKAVWSTGISVLKNEVNKKITEQMRGESQRKQQFDVHKVKGKVEG